MKLGTALRLLVAIVLLAVVAASGTSGQHDPAVSPLPSATLSDLEEIDQLRDLFNQRDGGPRLILLLSPT